MTDRQRETKHHMTDKQRGASFIPSSCQKYLQGSTHFSLCHAGRGDQDVPRQHVTVDAQESWKSTQGSSGCERIIPPPLQRSKDLLPQLFCRSANHVRTLRSLWQMRGEHEDAVMSLHDNPALFWQQSNKMHINQLT